MTTVTSPAPGVFISRPQWIGSAPLAADETPGNAAYDESRRIYQDTFAAALASEEAFWERVYCWWPYLEYRSLTPPPVPSPANAFFFLGGASSAASRTRSNEWTYPLEVPNDMRCARPQDRACSTRRISRSALAWILNNFIQSSSGSTYLFWRPLRTSQSISSSADYRSLRVVREVIGDDQQLSSSLFGDATPTLPAFAWTEPTNVVSALSSWQGAHTLDACTYDSIFRADAPDLDAAALDWIADAVRLCIGGWPSGGREAFVAAHQVTQLSAFRSILASAFGTPQLDYTQLRGQTRRLVLDRIAAYNQAAAAMDRLFSKRTSPYFRRPSRTTTYAVTGLASGTIPASAINVSSGRPVISPGVQVSWSPTVFNRSTSSVTTAVESLHFALVRNGNCSASTASPGQGLMPIYVPTRLLADFLSGNPPQSPIPLTIAPPVYSDDLGGSLIFSATRTDTMDTRTMYMAIQVPQPTGTIEVDVSGSAGYEYEASVPSQSTYNLAPFPAPRVWQTEVVKEVEECIFFVDVAGTTLDSTYYNTASAVACMRGVVASASAQEELLLQWESDNISRVKSELAADYPFAPADISELESQLNSAIEAAKNGVSFAPTLGVHGVGTLTGYLSGTADNPVMVYDEGPDYDGYLGSLHLDIGAIGSGSRSVPNMCRVIRLIDRIQRSDWSFNTLHLSP